MSLFDNQVINLYVHKKYTIILKIVALITNYVKVVNINFVH